MGAKASNGCATRQIRTSGSERGDGYKKPSSLGEGTGTKVPDNSEAPQRATASRLVPTHPCDPPETGKRRFGHSRDHRSDCVQVVIALIVTPEGFPLTYEVMPGNTSDKTTLGDFLRRIELQYGKAGRTWVMDRGIPTEAVLTEMRAAKTPTHYLVGTASVGMPRSITQVRPALPYWSSRSASRKSPSVVLSEVLPGIAS